MSGARHLMDYVLHDVEGVCWDVEGLACGHDTGYGYIGVTQASDQVTCKNCRRTKDFKWAAEHPCCTAP